MIGFKNTVLSFEKRAKASIVTLEGTLGTDLVGTTYGSIKQADSTNYLLLTHSTFAVVINFDTMVQLEKLNTVYSIANFARIAGAGVDKYIYVGVNLTNSLTTVF